MTTDQLLTLAILAGAFALFMWGRWRYDLVAFIALLAGVFAGVVPVDRAYVGFGHPAVVTVAAVLVISRALTNAGAIELLTTRLFAKLQSPALHLAALCAVAAVLSAFMNNVGALALLMPVAIQTAAKREMSPAMVLMPLSFASILGGLTTLIGTPPNIIIASYRARTAGEPFAMFDFSPVGGAVAVVGVVFVVIAGWRLIPRERLKRKAPAELFDIEDYVAEARVPRGAEVIGKSLGEIGAAAEAAEASIVGLIRKKEKIRLARWERLKSGDVLILEAAPEALGKAVSALGIELIAGGRPVTEALKSEDVALMEAVVTPRCLIDRRTPETIRFRRRHGVNLLAVSRQGRPHRGQLKDFRFQAGDVLLLQGEVDHVPAVIAALGCLPLAARELQLDRGGQAGAAALVFAIAILAAAFGLIAAPIALGAAAAGMVMLNIINTREAYEAIDWSIILLLGALIPVGEALETTGATALLAGGVAGLAEVAPPALILALVLVVTMTLSDVVNNAATAVVMAPIAVGVAAALGANPDAFLMAVAVGASCAFLTPIGHQNNTLVMGPGGYHFGDYWRMGLPLEVLIVAVAVPLILVVWPL